MNNQMPTLNPQTEPFDERVETLTRELGLALQWNRPCILLAVYNSEYVYADAKAALENSLIDLGQKIVYFKAEELQSSVASYLYKIQNPSGFVFFMKGVKQDPIFTSLNQHIDILKNRNIRIVFWLTQNEATEMATSMPELWNNRHYAVEFVDSPKPEQILQNAIESAWQGTGEFADAFEDMDAKITMRESLLTVLPEQEESTATRADLLLKLGILNWRKGDFEKADELLQNALKIAIRMEDNWFESECFNAIALVKSSQNKNDDAIEAYKQAIRIAPQQIFVWNNLGNLCLKISRNDEAMHAFQKAIEHNGKDPIAWNGLGAVYSKIGYIDDAISAYRKAIEYAPTLAHPWSGLGDAYVSVGRDVDAIAAYQKAIERNSQFITPWLRLADIYCKQMRHRDAIKAYQRTLAIDPKNSTVWNELGLLHLKTNLLEDAISAFNKAIEQDRSNGWAYCNLALAHSNQGANEQAIQFCLRGIELLNEDHDKAVAWDRLASLYRAVNDYDKALRAYQNVDVLNGRLPVQTTEPASDSTEVASVSDEAIQTESVIVKEEIIEIVEEPVTVQTVEEESTAPAWILYPSESSNEAPMEEPLMPTPDSVFQTPTLDVTTPENELPQTELIESEQTMTDSKNPSVWNEKGNIHFRNAEFDEAISAYNKAIELDRSFGWPYANLALTYLTTGKLAEAILLYQHSITLLKEDSDKASSWNSLGNIYRRMNDYENAIKAYQMADELDPQSAGRRDQADLAYSESNSQSAQVWTELGNLFFKAASYNEAVRAYTKAVNMDSESGWACSNLAMAYAFQGRHSEAVTWYVKSIDLFQNDKDKAVAWNRLGNVYRKLNDYDHAKEAYQYAAKLSNEKPSLLTRTRFSLLGNIYAG